MAHDRSTPEPGHNLVYVGPKSSSLGERTLVLGSEVLAEWRQQPPEMASEHPTASVDCPTCDAGAGRYCDARTLGRFPFHLARVHFAWRVFVEDLQPIEDYACPLCGGEVEWEIAHASVGACGLAQCRASARKTVQARDADGLFCVWLGGIAVRGGGDDVYLFCDLESVSGISQLMASRRWGQWRRGAFDFVQGSR